MLKILTMAKNPTQNYIDAVNAGLASHAQVNYNPDEEFKFMTESTVEKGEESEVEEGELTKEDIAHMDALMEARPLDASDSEPADFGHVRPPAPNVATYNSGERSEILPGNPDFTNWDKERLINNLTRMKDAFRIERGRCNAKTAIITTNEVCISKLQLKKRQLEVSEGNATKDNKRLKKTVRKVKHQRKALKETLTHQLEQITKLEDRRLLLRKRLIEVRKEANDNLSKLNDQIGINRQLHAMLPDPDEPESEPEPEDEEPTDIEPSSAEEVDEYQPGDQL